MSSAEPALGCSLLLLQPPVVKPSEPPLGLAVLQGYLRQQGFQVTSIDASLDAQLYLLDNGRLCQRAGKSPTTSMHRALRHGQESLSLLRSPEALDSFPRYTTAVRYLNQLLGLWACPDSQERLTLGDYQHTGYSCFNPADLQEFALGRARTLFHDYFVETLLPEIAQINADMVALSINYLQQVFPAFELAGLLRRTFPGVRLVAGGGVISSWRDILKEQALSLLPFDHLVCGPGEEALVDLLAGSRDDPFFDDGRQVEFIPDFSFARLSDYLSPRPLLPVTTSRGCYWRGCLFCPEATAPVQSYRSADSDQLVELLLELSRCHGVRDFHLTDNAIPVQVLRRLAQRCEDLRGLSWFGFVRFEKSLEEPDFVTALASSGCRMLQLGLESGSQEVLDRLGKGIRVESATKILHNLERAGIASYVYIMLGTPGETRFDAERTRDYLKAQATRIGYLNLSIMNLPRRSDVLDNPAAYDIIATSERVPNSSLGLYQKFQPKGEWNRAAARRFLSNELLRCPEVREMVKRIPPLFTSNHAAFFVPGKKAILSE